jgi:serine/threonine protein kinase
MLMNLIFLCDFSELPPHPNVIQFYGVSIDGPQPIIVLEYCAEGSLDVLLFDRGIKLTPDEKIKLVEGIAKGMFHLHKHNIVHRDLAARNILLSEKREPKISVLLLCHYIIQTEHSCGLSLLWIVSEIVGLGLWNVKISG